MVTNKNQEGWGSATMFSQEQNPVVDSTEGKFTAVSLIPYHTTKGLVMRSAGKSKLIGYCVESPKEVFQEVFGYYYVTRYNGYELFSSEDFEPTTPMLGLGIAPVKPPKVYGIEYNGRLENLLQLDELQKARRDDLVSPQEVLRIIDHFKEHIAKLEKSILPNPNKNQYIHDMQEIIDLVKVFPTKKVIDMIIKSSGNIPP